jgi:hypothetical protein
MSARCLMIALDGADGALLERWISDGTLPNLAALRSRGGARKLSAPQGVTDDALWASFQFCSGLGEHGRYHYVQRIDSGEMGLAFLNEAGRESFWDALSNQGRRVAIFDIPKCGLPKPLNGIHLADWLVHGRNFKQPKSYPESFAGEVIEKFSPPPPSRCGYQVPRLSDEDLPGMVSNLRKSIGMKRAAGLHYLESEAWDLFVIGFKESHCAGHHLWDLADPRDPNYDPARTAAFGDPVRTIFKDLDAAVGDLIAAAGPAATVAVFSTTDMEPNATLIHLMPKIVRGMNRILGESFAAKLVNHLAWRLKAPQPLARPCELLPYNENCTALRVNPRWGLFPRPPGDERVKVGMMERIESLLRELTDADTGHPVIAAMDRPSSDYTGTRATALPDLLVHYKSGTFPRAVVSPRLGRIEGDRPRMRPGNHAGGGYLVFSGEEFTGVTGLQDLGPASARVLDVAMK